MEDIILNEKNKYNKVYTELMFCVDDLRKMLDTEELEKRSFISKVDTLKEYTAKCDKDTTLLTKTTDTVELYQGDEKFVFNVAGYLVEKDDNGNFSRYVYLIDSKDYDNQHILKYSKFKGEESYDSVITDGTQDELIRINDKFIEMGLRV